MFLPEFISGEDTAFLFEAVLFCKKIVTINNTRYNYCFRDGSADSYTISEQMACSKIYVWKRILFLINRYIKNQIKYLELYSSKIILFLTLFQRAIICSNYDAIHLSIAQAISEYLDMSHEKFAKIDRIMSYDKNVTYFLLHMNTG